MKKNYIFIGGAIVAGLVIGGIVVYEAYKAVQRKKEAEDIEKGLDEFDKKMDALDEMEKELEDFLEEEDEDSHIFTDSFLKRFHDEDADEDEDEEEDMPVISSELETVLAENEHPRDDDEEAKDISEEELEEIENDYELDKFYRENKNRPPRIISEDAVKDLPEIFDTEEWIYWTKDDVMTDEEGEVIEDWMRFVGDELDRYEWRDNDESEAWVISYEFSTVYHVEKYIRSYSDEKGAQYAADYESANS